MTGQALEIDMTGEGGFVDVFGDPRDDGNWLTAGGDRSLAGGLATLTATSRIPRRTSAENTG
jgi:hypothetical protein